MWYILTHWTEGVDAISDGDFAKGAPYPTSIQLSPVFLAKCKSVSNQILEKANEKKVGMG